MASLYGNLKVYLMHLKYEYEYIAVIRYVLGNQSFFKKSLRWFM